MKKLKTKVFWVILSLLTIFLISILTIFNYQDYFFAEERVKQNLIKAEKFNMDKKTNNHNPRPDDNRTPESMMFMDSNIYTIILNKENNIVDIINNSDKTITNEEIEKMALKIINNSNKSHEYLGNIYFNSTAYIFHSGSFLILADISDIHNELMSSLRISFLIFILLESIIIFISNILTSWIIKPVNKAFEKQKQFVADASHELKTPLAVIMASSDALESNPKEIKWINNIKNESERMNKLIKNLLDLAKYEDNINIKETFKNTNISKLIELQVLSFESLMYEEKIKLETKITDNIYMSVNQEQIKELISVLLDNAIKHSVKKGKIIVILKREKTNIILEIQNKGDAIPKEEEEKIFERFYRIDKSRNRSEVRYGLGLAIAKNIVVNHMGEISAHSDKGYTTFKIVFKEKIL